MDQAIIDRWDDRYRIDEYAYGEEPNDYLKEQLPKLDVGTILFPADGEGRNGVYAAKLGWKVSSFDLSIEGQKKALRLAQVNHVTIDYQVGGVQALKYDAGQFDAIALIYAHFPADIKSSCHKLLDGYLRRRGIVIFEAFSKNHVEYRARNERVGGPTELAMLFSIEEVKSDFKNYEVIELEEKVVELNEGKFHGGTGSVIRFVGRKK